jgi:hypothetical protein
MKQNFDKKWATFFYKANNPFNVAYHPTFIDVVKSTFDCKILYKLLSYHIIWIQLLKNSKKDLSKLLTNRTKNAIHKYGAIICSDEWDNINSCFLLNIILVYPNGNLFLKTINTIEDWKDA